MIGELATLVTALAGLIGIVLTYLLNRQKRAATDAQKSAKERNRLWRYVEILLRHIHELRTLLAQQGIEAPPMPDEPTGDPE